MTDFLISYSDDGIVSSIVNRIDPYKMNWIRDKKDSSFERDNFWGKLTMPEGVCCKVKRDLTNNGNFREQYVFRNTTDRDIYVQKGEIGIALPLYDAYSDAKTCMKYRCHVHLWCGEEASYLLALRMGKEAPHLGMALQKGSLSCYSLVRDTSRSSNDRGIFFVHPSPCILEPYSSMTIQWEWFWHTGKNDFFEKLSQYMPVIQAEKYIFFREESIQFSLKTNKKPSDLSVSRNGQKIPIKVIKDFKSSFLYYFEDPVKELGEYCYEIKIDGKNTHALFLATENPAYLEQKRCHFLVEKQQCLRSDSRLYGAFLIFDREEQRQFYSHRFDLNGGRERVCMGILLANYLERQKETKGEIPEVQSTIYHSLKRYEAFVKRELVEEETGMVHNDIGYRDDIIRLYNYPWFAHFFLKMFQLDENKDSLLCAYRIIRQFYQQGGDHFYAIGIPMVDSISLLCENGMNEEAETLKLLYLQHADVILSYGMDYPSHEVNYEQSIVAPATWILLQAYELSGRSDYFENALEHVKILELFQSPCPDYHMYANSIRHWDGYWFGKNQYWGDTFPHYWSVLTANIYHLLTDLGVSGYEKKAEAAYRAVLSLYHEDGSATCAYLYPFSVNGRKITGEDPYANDQDWGLYYYQNAHREKLI